MTKYVSFNENQISGVKKQTKLKGGRRLTLAGSRDVKSGGKRSHPSFHLVVVVVVCVC